MIADHTPRIYPIYRSLIEAHFWLPVFFLYFNQLVDVQGVLLLESVYYIGVVITEVPSGYFADRYGRKATLMIAAVSLLLAYLAFFLAHDLWWLVAGQVLLAIGLSFNSGADTALHHDSLVVAGLAHEYPDREARAAKYALLGGAIAALLGGLVAIITLRTAYLLSIIGAIAAVSCVLMMKEPALVQKKAASQFFSQLTSCIRRLKDRVLLWLFCFAVMMVILNHIPYMFYQPYMDMLVGLFKVNTGTPAVTGFQTALTLLLAAIVAGFSVRVQKRIGTAGVLLTSMALQLVIITTMAIAIHPIVAIVIVARSVPRGLLQAPLNAAVVPRVPANERATYMSLQSLAGRLGFALYLVAMAMLPNSGSDDWTNIRLLLVIGSVIGLITITTLGLSARKTISVTD